MGPKVLNTVGQMMADPDQKASLRRALPQVLAEFEDQRIVNGILAHLPEEDLPLHYQAIKTLGKMRSRYQELRFSAREVDRLLRKESLTYCTTASRWVTIRSAIPHCDSQALLQRALEERLEFTRERIFRLMGLIYPAGDIFNAWHRIVHGRPPVRAAALEFLGNLLNNKHKETLLPLLEASSWSEIATSGPCSGAVISPRPDFQETVIELIEGPDAWLAACSVTLAGELGLSRALEPTLAAMNHEDRVVQQAARAVAERLSPPKNP
jgi:hypothetical protein